MMTDRPDPFPYRVTFVNIASGKRYTAKLATLVDAERYAQRHASRPDTYRDVHIVRVQEGPR